MRPAPSPPSSANASHAGVWLAGVECDGAQYHSSATARDCDRIRKAVLQGLGWSILRIWSTDWFRAPGATLERVCDRLSTLLVEERRRRAESALPEADPVAAEPFPDLAPAHADLPPAPASAPEPEPRFARDPSQTADAVSESAPAAVDHPDPARFFEADYTPKLTALMASVVSADGPVPEATLARRIAQLHGWQRTGARIQARIAALQGIFDVTAEGETRFLWPPGSRRDRIPCKGLGDRALREMSRAGIAGLIDRHAAQIAGAEDPDLEPARLLGIARLTRDAQDDLSACRSRRDATAPGGAERAAQPGPGG